MNRSFSIERTAGVARWFCLAAFLLSAREVMAQCPTINNTGCAAVITITDAGSSISLTGQGTYGTANGNNDGTPTGILVGVINDSSEPLYALEVTSPNQIFAFEYDGIDNYGVPGNASDNTGYGGPNAYYTNITNYLSDGIVNFITPISPNGGSSYFSLAALISSGTACSDLLNNALTPPVGGSTSIAASFTPNNGYSLANAAQVCGFTNFNWQQLITVLPSPSPFYAVNGSNLTSPVPFNDPPPAGYTYQSPPNTVGLPIYYNLSGSQNDPLSLTFNEASNALFFFDAPADDCLPGGSGNGCGGATALASNNFIGFSTHLVGIVGNGSNATVQDTGIGFAWTDTFNGTVGGISVLDGYRPVDPHSGTGGITVTAVNRTSTYQYPKTLVIKSVNGHAAPAPTPLQLLTKPQVETLITPPLYVPFDKTYYGLVVFQNTSSKTIEGPFQLVAYSLPQGVTLKNATGVFATAPFYTIPSVAKLDSGAFAFAVLQFSGPGSAKIVYSPTIYSGGFN